MNPVPFLMRFASGWNDIKAEVNDFATQRQLPTYDNVPLKYRFEGWGTVGFPPRLACNLVIFLEDQAIPVGKRFHGQVNDAPEHQLLALLVEDGRLITSRWGTLRGAMSYLNTPGGKAIFDPLTGLYWAPLPVQYTSLAIGPTTAHDQARQMLLDQGYAPKVYGGSFPTSGSY